MVLDKNFDLSRLTSAISYNRRVLEDYRREYNAAVRATAGSHYSGETAVDRRSPVNMLSLYQQVVLRSLAPKAPRVALSTFNRQMKPAVNVMQGWANKQLDKIRFGNTLQRFVADALYSCGILKIALANPSESIMSAGAVNPGEVFARVVNIDDWVCDTKARDLSECSFLGHRYRVPLETIRDSKLYSKRRKDLVPSIIAEFNVEGDQRINALGGGFNIGLEDDWVDWIELWEIYLPQFKCCYVFAADDLDGPSSSGARVEPLRAFDWVGPPTGPYHFLEMLRVPGNCMPKGPIQDLVDLNEMQNSSMRKLRNQAEREKVVTAVRNGMQSDGQRIMNANDGEMINVEDPSSIVVMAMGGITQVGEAWSRITKDLFSSMAGNLDAMAGLGPSAKTATQDKMITEGASRNVADMQEKTLTATTSAIRAMCWYWWHDPYRTMTDVHSLPGLPDMAMQRRATPEQRIQGSWDDIDLHVDPYSMQHSTPQSKLAQIMGITKDIILPMFQSGMAEKQGIGFDLNKFLTLASQLMDVPEIEEFVTLQEQPLQLEGEGGGPEMPGMPLSRTSTHVRESTSEKTRQGQDRSAIQNLLGSAASSGGGQGGSARMASENRMNGSAA